MNRIVEHVPSNRQRQSVLSKSIKPNLLMSTMPSSSLTKQSSNYSLLAQRHYHNDNNKFRQMPNLSIGYQYKEEKNIIRNHLYNNNNGERKQKQRQYNQNDGKGKNKQKQLDFNKNTQDIQNYINERIKCENNLSMEILRNNTMKYYYGSNYVYPQTIKAIPKEVLQTLTKVKSIKNKVHFVYGYLKNIHALYYIIEDQLYIVNYQSLKNQQNDKRNNQNKRNIIKQQQISKDKHEDKLRNNQQQQFKRKPQFFYKKRQVQKEKIEEINKTNLSVSIKQQQIQRLKIKANCSCIYQIQLNNRLIPSQYRNNILIFQYPFQIQLCAYEINFIQSRKQLKFINLDMRIAIQSINAKFVTATQSGNLLYVDDNGNLNILQLSGGLINNTNKMKNNLLKVNNKRQSMYKKKLFIFRNKTFMKMAKFTFRMLSNTLFSLFLSKMKILKLIQDSNTNRVYTLIQKTSQKNIIQYYKKVIKIYNMLNNTHNNQAKQLQAKCIWQIQQSQIIDQICTRFNFKPKWQYKIFTIQKVNNDYNQQADLIIVLDNGIQVYLSIGQDQVRSLEKQLQPDCQKVYNIKTQIKNKQENLTLIDKITLFNNNNHKLPFTQSKTNKLKAFYKNRRFVLSLLADEKNKKSYFCLTHKDYLDNQKCIVKDIQWESQSYYKNNHISQQNQIHQMTEYYLLNSLEENRGNSYVNMLKLAQGVKGSNNINNNNIIDNNNNNLININNNNLININKNNVIDINKTISNNILNSSIRPYSKNPIAIQHSHQLLRQLYFPIRNFIYISNHFISNIWLLRPIDILYMHLVYCTIQFNKKYLLKMMGLNSEEICSMLLHMYCERQIHYYISTRYVQKIQSIQKQQLVKQKYNQNLSNNYKKINSHQNYKSNNHVINQSSIINLYIQPNQIIRHKINIFKQIKLKIQQLFLTLTTEQKKQQKQLSFEQLLNKRLFKQNNNNNLHNNNDHDDKKFITQYNMIKLFISRQMYPFWNIPSLNRVSVVILSQIRQKVGNLFHVVQLLKMYNNDKYRKVQFFIKKVIQILLIFQHIQLPTNLSLSQAITKPFEYYQPFIFNMIKRQTQSQIMVLYEKLFPFYISRQFQLLIKIYAEIDRVYNDDIIMDILQRLSHYPEYFVEYLEKQKKFKDVRFIKIKRQHVKMQFQIEIPLHLPFLNKLEFFISKIKLRSIGIKQKFQYLSQYKLQIQKNSNIVNQKMLIPAETIKTYKLKYQQFFDSLKIQQLCKDELIKKVKQLDQQPNLRFKQQNKRYQNLFEKVKQLFFPQRQIIIHPNQDYQKKNKQKDSINELMSFIDLLNYNFFIPKQLLNLVRIIDQPQIWIAFSIVFGQNRQINRNYHIFGLNQTVIEKAQELIQKGIKKYINTAEKQKSKIIKSLNYLNQYLRTSFRQVSIVLNSCNKKFNFVQIYQGYQKGYYKFNQIKKFILQNQTNSLFLIANQFKHYFQNKQIQTYLKKQIDKFFTHNRKTIDKLTFRRFKNQDHQYRKPFNIIDKQKEDIVGQRIDQNFLQKTQKMIMKWYNCVQLIIKYNKQDLPWLYQKTQGLYVLLGEELQQRQEKLQIVVKKQLQKIQKLLKNYNKY